MCSGSFPENFPVSGSTVVNIQREHDFTILNSQFENIHGLQDTKNTPFFMDLENKWNTDRKLIPQTPPTCQLHFDGANHWVTSVQSEHESNIYYLDSLGETIKDIKSNVKIQLSQIYGNPSVKTLNVKIPRLQQQPNSFDCGVFAIANAVEFCHNQSLNFRQTYVVSEMRPHLIKCLESGVFLTFC